MTKRAELANPEAKPSDDVEVLTELDLKIFQVLLEQKYLTMDLLLLKLSPGEFRSRNRSSKTCKRIYWLTKHGYLQTAQDGRTVIYLLTALGADIIRKSGGLYFEPVSELDTQSLGHDLICSQVRFYFESFAQLRWVSEREFRCKVLKYDHYSDAMFLWGDLSVFLEVELTKKSIKRYRDLKRFFMRPKGPDRILYFYRGESLLMTLQEQLGANPKIGFFPYTETLPLPAHLIGSAQGNAITLAEFLSPKYLNKPAGKSEGETKRS